MRIQKSLFIFLLTAFWLVKPVYSNPAYTSDFGSQESKLDYYTKRAEELKSTSPDSALVYAKLSIRIAENVEDVKAQAKMNLLIGRLLDKHGSFEQAIEYLISALNRYKEMDNKKMTAIVQNQLGRTYSEAFLYNSSLPHLKQALSYYQKENDQLNIGYTLINFGFVFEKSDNANKALSYYKQAKETVKSLKDSSIIITLEEAFGSVYEDLGQYEYALEKYKWVLPHYKDNIFDRIDVLNNIGDCHLKSGDSEKALPYYKKAYKLAKDKGISWKIEQNAKDLAKTYEAMKMDSIALQYFKEHLTMYKEFYNKQSTSHIHQLQILYDIDQKNKEIELQKSQTRAALRTRVFALISAVFLLIVVLILWRNIRIKTELNRKLKKQNHEIETQRSKLQLANEELTSTLNQLQETQNKLVHAEKMATVGTLSAGIAHEINNPLNYIQSGVDILDFQLNNQAKDADLPKVLEAIKQGALRATKIVKSLNHFSRQNESLNETCNIHQIIDNCLTMLQYTIKNRIEVNKNYSEDAIVCLGNDGNLHQVFLNILANATQAIEKEGFITVETSIIDSMITVRISDSGTGIAPSIISKIKDPFFTTKDPGVGTGLGLSITNKIVEDHKGDFLVESELGIGTSMIIKLPVR
ncbi:tetratricopeptide repeat protein [Reichenbachiella versicolor]|uniref:tetratricopeptide repeat protein n=1 Tax=Reichenbachiella versicolor TaxID=1821036 RepID=UPI000D6DFBF4|nr:tetratricopeptide repeat protein [Reichenbachiella versicolor]